MRVAFVSQHDPTDARAWSGIVRHMAGALARVPGVELTPIAPLPVPAPLRVLTKARAAWYRWVLNQTYAADREPAVRDALGRRAAARVVAAAPDVVLCPSTVPLGRLRDHLAAAAGGRAIPPLAFWTDATFAGLAGFYFARVCRRTLRQAAEQERAAVAAADLAVYSSDWAAQSAVREYGADPARVAVVPFGANLDAAPGDGAARGFIRARGAADGAAGPAPGRPRTCRLLFLGVDWVRKGGDFAVEVARQLQAAGLDATLDVVGCAPALAEAGPAGRSALVRGYGFLSKAHPEQRARLERLLADAHWLILPSRAEACAIVFGEAGAYGVPCLVRDVGGVRSAVADDQNGLVFPADAPAAAWAERIARVMADPPRYDRMALAARAAYDTRLNWDTAAGRVAGLLRGLVTGMPAR